MAVILEAAYSKKLGLPNYSSHSYVVSIRTELSDLTQVEAESARLYALLQQSVDSEIQQVGFLPDATTYGMDVAGTERSAPSDDGHHHGNGQSNHARSRPDSPAARQPLGVLGQAEGTRSSSWSNSTGWTNRRSKRWPRRCSACRSRRSTGCKPAG